MERQGEKHDLRPFCVHNFLLPRFSFNGKFSHLQPELEANVDALPMSLFASLPNHFLSPKSRRTMCPPGLRPHWRPAASSPQPSASLARRSPHRRCFVTMRPAAAMPPPRFFAPSPRPAGAPPSAQRPSATLPPSQTQLGRPPQQCWRPTPRRHDSATIAPAAPPCWCRCSATGSTRRRSSGAPPPTPLCIGRPGSLSGSPAA
ncbi:unnamed protein product, partial [Phaeothamnion confervicola]